MYLLDTNICIALLKGNSLAVNQFKVKYQNCYLSTLVIAELYKGVYCSSRIQENLATLERFILQMLVVDFDKNAAQEFGKIQAELRILGKPTGQVDALIGAVARSRHDTLVSDNTRHFTNIANFYLENWLSS